MKRGYIGKILFADLTKGSLEERVLSDDLARHFIGGYGIGARVLYDMMKPGVDPLGPENVLGFVSGPLTGTGALFGARYTVVCKSPVTLGWNDANSGGFFGPELKKAGFDAVFIWGASSKPVYLFIKDGKAEIRDASGLWGKDSVKTLEGLMEETGENKLRAALIGPAGEKQSLMSCVINDKHRAAARGGPGAVMGSKNLKAVAVRGTGKISVADPEMIRKINAEIVHAMKNGPGAKMMDGMGTFGTGMGTDMSALIGDTPTKNWGGISGIDMGKASVEKLSTVFFDGKYKKKKYACANCPLGCGAHYHVDGGKWPVGETDRPEYETLAAFGTLILNDDVECILKCNDICNKYGLDTISVGATIAWAMECYEEGIFAKEDTGGIELSWGNAEAIVAITQAIADQTGFGNFLALGSARASKKMGKGAEYLQTVQGIELPMHDPRFLPGLARIYQYDPTPGRHVKGGLGFTELWAPAEVRYNYEGKGQPDVEYTCATEVLNASGLCQFSRFAMPQDALARFISAATGWDFAEKDVFQAGLRIMDMRYAFNLREGQKPTDNLLPSRCVGEPAQTEGPLKGVTINPKILAEQFFENIGWDKETMMPSRESLENLGGMDDVIRNLYG